MCRRRGARTKQEDPLISDATVKTIGENCHRHRLGQRVGCSSDRHLAAQCDYGQIDLSHPGDFRCPGASSVDDCAAGNGLRFGEDVDHAATEGSKLTGRRLEKPYSEPESSFAVATLNLGGSQKTINVRKRSAEDAFGSEVRIVLQHLAGRKFMRCCIANGLLDGERFTQTLKLVGSGGDEEIAARLIARGDSGFILELEELLQRKE